MKRLFQFALILAISLFSATKTNAIATSEQLAIKAAQLNGPGPRVVEDSYAMCSLASSERSFSLSKAESTPIEGWIFDEELEYVFNESLGSVTITLTNENGIAVYRKSINTNYFGSGSIDLSNLTAGNYKLNFIVKGRPAYYAEFTIK